MGRIILVLGGARSGKSAYAVRLAAAMDRRTAYVATLEFHDAEMDDRIKLHRAQRPPGWRTIEEGRNVDTVLDSLHSSHDVVIIDCLTNLVSNLLLQGLSREAIEKRIENLFAVARRVPFTTIVVTNEVGCGLVPETPLGRSFRDVAGVANQMAAREADEVFLVTAGIPLRLKP